MLAIPGAAAGLATARPGAGAGGPDAAAADPGGFDEVFSDEGADAPERPDHRARTGDEDDAAPTGDAPAVASAPPEQVRLPSEAKGEVEAATVPEAAGAAVPTGSPGMAALADPAEAAMDISAPAEQRLTDGETPPEGKFDLGKALADNGDGMDKVAVDPDVAGAPSAEPEATTNPATDSAAADDPPAASPATATRSDQMEAAVSAVAEALKPQKTETPEGPTHSRHRRDDAAEPASERATAPSSRPAQESTEAARPVHPPGHDQPLSLDRHPLSDAPPTDPLAPTSGPRAAAEVRQAPGHIVRALHQLPDGFTLRLAPHLPQQGGRAVEITLTPEELGKVRMQVALSGDALTLTIAAHRPETLDLLRSHIDQLAREFRDLGFDRLEFGFARDQGQENLAGQGGGPDTRAGDLADAMAAPTPLSASPPGRPARDLALAGAGLDLRL